MITQWSDLLASPARVRTIVPRQLLWLFKQDGELILPVVGSIGYGDNLKLSCISHVYQTPKACGVVAKIVAMQLPALVSVPAGTQVVAAQLVGQDRLIIPQLYLASMFGLDLSSSQNPLYVCVHEDSLGTIDSQQYFGDPM